jgi:Protein of unknown function (DUF3833)
MANDMSPMRSGALFELTTFLEGRVSAWGIFEDRFGRVRRKFEVEMEGRWRDRLFELNESFRYEDGTTETRVWTVVPGGAPGHFTATCADCVGEARGVCDAESIRMRYRFRLRMDARTLNVDFDDRIYRVGDGIAVNRTTMSKWGIKLGELSLFFERHDKHSVASDERRVA